MTYTLEEINKIAHIAHEANRAYCATIGDNSQVEFTSAPEWQRKSLILGVESVLSGVSKSPEDQHSLWLAVKAADGWVYGPVKDPVARTHPCIVAYKDLPAEQKVKDYLFRAIVSVFKKESEPEQEGS